VTKLGCNGQCLPTGEGIGGGGGGRESSGGGNWVSDSIRTTFVLAMAVPLICSYAS